VKVCLFVDGENFRHSIVDLFPPPQFYQEDYLPKRANWNDLFDWIVNTAIDDGERIRTYWYVIEHIDFFPYRIPNLSPTTREQIKNILCKYEPYETELNALNDADCDARMTEIVVELRHRRDIMQERFNGWVSVQDGISLRHKAVEFRHAGAIKCDLFTNKLGREKAVDVKLATDIILLEDIYDIAIIVSGDQDYVPAVEVIKDFGKRVVNVAFTTRSGQLLPGGARRLNQKTDWCCNIPYNQLATHLGIRLP
jgi:uncharacterized LabA/DUF88 family protein